MSLAETKSIRGRALHHVVGRVKELVGLGPHPGMRRVAGMAFLIRVGNAGTLADTAHLTLRELFMVDFARKPFPQLFIAYNLNRRKCLV